jgi:hypothetical protein
MTFHAARFLAGSVHPAPGEDLSCAFYIVYRTICFVFFDVGSGLNGAASDRPERSHLEMFHNFSPTKAAIWR